MHAHARSCLLGAAMLLPLAASLAPALHAQDDGPPNVLVMQREFLKPGKGGMLHDRSESAFVRAFSSGEPNVHYFALDALSGPSRSLFLASYDSFAAWEKELNAIHANKEKAAAVDRAQLADGDLLSNYDAVALMLRPDLSLNKGHIKGTRYFEIMAFVVKPGHRHEFAELAHLYADAYRKAAPDAHWDCFEAVYGTPLPSFPGVTFVVINTMDSLAETDGGMRNSEKVAAALGPDGMKKVEELTAASVETQTTNLFAINPRISNPSADWVKRDPDFWKGPVPSGK